MFDVLFFLPSFVFLLFIFNVCLRCFSRFFFFLFRLICFVFISCSFVFPSNWIGVFHFWISFQKISWRSIIVFLLEIILMCLTIKCVQSVFCALLTRISSRVQIQRKTAFIFDHNWKWAQIKTVIYFANTLPLCRLQLWKTVAELNLGLCAVVFWKRSTKPEWNKKKLRALVLCIFKFNQAFVSWKTSWYFLCKTLSFVYLQSVCIKDAFSLSVLFSHSLSFASFQSAS